MHGNQGDLKDTARKPESDEEGNIKTEIHEKGKGHLEKDAQEIAKT